ncbi:hypothetical protein RI129_006095 [Pyrocoelia pectoralis]|uniref:Uncharacterized protein n=1 Tax=Pyrocoelia pectoralis TaxID=417401 RepID=A0AAN7ZFX4_9COLE
MMFWLCLFILVTATIEKVYLQKMISAAGRELSPLKKSLDTIPTMATGWSILNQIAMTDDGSVEVGRKKRKKFKKKLKKLVLPLLLAYKMKFFALIPILVGGLMLLTASTGIAGFFFALFVASLALKSGYK